MWAIFFAYLVKLCTRFARLPISSGKFRGEFENWFQNYATAIKEHPELMAPYFELYNYYFGSEQFQNAADISRKQLSVNDTLSIAQENLQRALERLK